MSNVNGRARVDPHGGRAARGYSRVQRERANQSDSYIAAGRDGRGRPVLNQSDTAARDARIVELRLAGWTTRAVAAELGCSADTVSRVGTNAIARQRYERWITSQRRMWTDAVAYPYATDDDRALARRQIQRLDDGTYRGTHCD